MRIGLWGWFHARNYGDELIALHLGKMVAGLGASPVAFGLPAEVGAPHGIECTDDPDRFFGTISFCLLAAGGFLIDRRESLNQVTDRFQSLAIWAKRKNVRLYPFSVGGSGQGRRTDLREGIADLWKQGLCGESIVRLPEDVALIRSLGGKAVYLPDMLWDAARSFEIGRGRLPGEDGIERIGVNLLSSLVEPGFAERLAERIPENVELHFFAVHSDSATSGETLPVRQTERIRKFEHRDPLDLLRFLGTLDGIVSCKLHAGLTGLSLGTPFISCQGKSKSRRQLELIDARLVQNDPNQVMDSLFRTPGSLAKLPIPWRKIERMKRKAGNHRGYLLTLLKRHRHG